MTLYKPTAEEKRIIRDCARRSADCRNVEINPSTKINERGDTHMNVAMISDDPDFGDTDLDDNAFTWRDFTKGVEMTADARAIVDFYVYSRGRDAELKTNVTVYVERGRLVRVDGTCNVALWKAAE